LIDTFSHRQSLIFFTSTNFVSFKMLENKFDAETNLLKKDLEEMFLLQKDKTEKEITLLSMIDKEEIGRQKIEELGLLLGEKEYAMGMERMEKELLIKR
jgi:hypothetical protein